MAGIIDRVETLPGSIWVHPSSPQFAVEFIGQLSRNMRQHHDYWMGVIFNIFTSLYKFPTSAKGIEQYLVASLKNSKYSKYCQVSAILEDDSQDNSTKLLTINFYDAFGNTLFLT